MIARLSALTLALVVFAPPPLAVGQAKPTELNSLSMEVAALDMLRNLELRPDQLRALTELANGAAETEATRPAAKATAAFRQALTNLHGALVRGDGNKIADARDKLDALLDKDSPEIHDEIRISDIARERAGKAVKLLTVPQIGAFLTAQQLADPMDVLNDGFHQIRQAKGADKDQMRDQIADEVAWLVGGIGTEEETKVRTQATELLNRAAGLADDEYKRQLGKLRIEARKIVGQPDAVEVIRHTLDHGMAELLSNPRLGVAIEATKRKPPSGPRK